MDWPADFQNHFAEEGMESFLVPTNDSCLRATVLRTALHPNW